MLKTNQFNLHNLNQRSEKSEGWGRGSEGPCFHDSSISDSELLFDYLFIFYCPLNHFKCPLLRQKVRMAAELLSKSSVDAIRLLFPNDADMLTLAEFIEEVDNWFDVMNR